MESGVQTCKLMESQNPRTVWAGKGL